MATGWYPCDDCGRTFSSMRGLSRHRNYSHVETAREERARAKETLAPVIEFDPFGHLAAPLEAELERLDAELADVDAQHLALLKRVGPIRAALTELRGKPAKVKSASKKTEPARGVSAETLALVGGFIDGHRSELRGGFITHQLYTLMQENGGGTPSVDRVRLALNELHEQGSLRLVRMTQGGGKLFAPMTDV